MEADTEGRVALVTGAGSGLGAATARAFAAAGFAVACLDVDVGAAKRLADSLGLGARVTALGVDVSDPQAVKSSIEAVVKQHGRLDVAVNNAAIDHTISVEDMSLEQWRRVIDVNLSGPFLVSKSVFPVMREQGSGHIVNIASTAATRAWANAAAYHASKWGLVGFSRGLGVEGRPYGIKVTTVIPGGMRTSFFDRFVEQGIPMPQEENLQDPGNVARVILFAVQMPAESALQEVIVTPLTETSWP